MINIKDVRCEKILEDVDISMYTTYKLKGKAKYLAIPKDIHELVNLIYYLKDNNIKFKIIGMGSNLIFEDEFYDGFLIKLDNFKDITIRKNIIKVGAGYILSKLALETCNMGFKGLEFAVGIPGTLGGAVFNNSGAYNSDMGYVVDQITVLTPDYKIKTLYNEQLDFHYRTSFLKKNDGYICLDVTIKLELGNKEELKEIIEDRKRRRLESQPIEYPSAGSVFRNPKNEHVGKIIEDLGFKGKRVGDASVSKKHANFIINEGKATGKDVIQLISQIKRKVKEEYGIDLVLEQEIVK